MFRLALLSALFQAANSKHLFSLQDSAISPKSRFGKSLLANARRLEENEGQQGDDANQVDYSFMSGYSIKFEHCMSNVNCNYDDDDNAGGNCQSLVHFSLCPADYSCESGCAYGAEYVVDMYYFIDAFTEAQLGAREYACEMARENCEGDDDGCYANYGVDNCDEEEGNFNLQKYLECNQFGDGDDDAAYYLAPYCASDGYNIYLGLYSDNACTVQESDDTFEELFGYELDYSASSQYSIVSDECANCQEHGDAKDQGEGDQEDEDDVLEQCEDLYAAASGCEMNIDVENPDYDACDYITEIKNSFASNNSETYENQSRRASPGKIVLIALLIGAAILGCCWFIGKKKATSQAPLLGTSPGVA